MWTGASRSGTCLMATAIFMLIIILDAEGPGCAFYSAPSAQKLPAIRPPANFHLPVHDACFEAGLRMDRRAIDDVTVGKIELGLVPGANNCVAVQSSFREWPAEVGTGFRQREDALPAANQQDGDAVVLGARGHVVFQVRLRHHRNKILW